MKLSRSLASLVLATSIGFTGSVYAVTDVATLQQGSLAQLKVESEKLAADGAEYQRLAGILSTAKAKAAGYEIDIEDGGKLTTAGSLLVPAAGGARVYQEVAKQRGPFVTRGKRPMEILIGLGALAFGGGYLMRKNGAKYIGLSQADVIGAVESLNQKRADMEFRRNMIADIAKRSGATVTQNITTNENVVTVSGLDGLQNIIGSGVMTLPLPMPVPMPMFQHQAPAK